MIVVDTSALIAILFREPEAEAFENMIFADGAASIATPSVFEFLMVARRSAEKEIVAEARALLDIPGFVSMEWTPIHANAAFDAFLKFGKGHHPAKLNYGDCMSYALAKSLNAPLLYKGDDFAKTDIISAA